jgi:AMP nucleosidase
MISTGVKTSKSDNLVTKKYVEDHVRIGIEALKEIRDNKESVKHLRF